MKRRCTIPVGLEKSYFIMDDSAKRELLARTTCAGLARFSVLGTINSKDFDEIMFRLRKAGQLNPLPNTVFDEIRQIHRESQGSTVPAVRQGLAQACRSVFADQIVAAIQGGRSHVL